MDKTIAAGGTAGRATSVYRYYDANGILIYVGITKRGTSRNFEHSSHAAWWQYVASQEVEHYETRAEAHSREVALIQRHRPPFNVQHNVDSKSLRAAYFSLAQQPAEYEDGVELMHALERRLPLDIVSSELGRNRLVLRTKLFHRAIGGRLQWRGPVPVTGPQKSGQVVGLEVRGAIATLEIQRRGTFEVVGAYGTVRAINNEKPQGFRITSVHLENAEMAERALLKRLETAGA